MADFTLNEYKLLLSALSNYHYSFMVFEEFMVEHDTRAVVLRHDVDRHPLRALRMASIEAEAGIRASYHFRIGKESNDPGIIKEIVAQGHEIAYHYEDFNKAASAKGVGHIKAELASGAMYSFRENLKYFRQFYPVRVISMHGDPRYSTDNRELWEHYDYRAEGVVCEPYLDIDYSSTLYLTDTGRRWNGSLSNIRDKIRPGYGKTAGEPLSSGYHFRSTENIIASLVKGLMPERLILNTHPQRWTDRAFPWLTELFWQNTKNVVKGILSAAR